MENNAKLKHKEEQTLTWNKSLIRAEFLKIYFDYLGFNDTLNIERPTTIYDFQREKDKDKLLFAIASINESSNVITRLKEDKDVAKKLNENLVDKTGIKIMYPEQNNEDSSLNFIELALTGFINLNNKSLYKSNSPIAMFFNQLNLSKSKDNFENLDKFFKSNEALNTKHNEIVNDVFRNELSKIRNESAQHANYSLFFEHQGKLYEYISSINLLQVIKPEGITEANMAEVINNHIIQKNQEENDLAGAALDEERVYFDDVVLFSEKYDKSKEETISSNLGEFLIILLSSILFIVNFMLALPQSAFYTQKTYLYDLFQMKNTTYLYNQSDVINYTDGLLSIIYDKEIKGRNFSLELNDPNIDEVDTTHINDKYYFGDTNVYYGMAVNYKERQKDNQTQMKYFGHEFKSPSVNSNKNCLYDNTHQIFFSHNNTIKKARSSLTKLSNLQLAQLKITIMVFNLDHRLITMDLLKFDFLPLGNVVFKRDFEGFCPFLNKGSISISLLVLNIFYLLTLAYDSYRIVNLITNRIIDYCKQKIYSFEATDWLDLVTYILVLASQIWFYVQLLWRNSTFPLTDINESTFKQWVDFTYEMRMYKNFTGVCLLLVVFKLIRFIYNSFPALGIVFETFSLAINELVSLFILIFVMIIGMFFMFQSTLGGYSDSYFSFGNAFLSLYMLFFGIFDYDRDYLYLNGGNPLTPYLWVVFFVVFQLIMCNVFLCLIQSTFKDVKERKQMLNDAVFKMTTESLIGLYQKLKNLVLFIEPGKEQTINEQNKSESCLISEDEENEFNEDASNENENVNTVDNLNNNNNKDSNNKDITKNDINNNNNQDAPAEDAEIVMKITQKNWYKIFKYNLAALQLGSFFKKKTLNLEEYEHQKQEKFTKIRKEIMNNYIK